jgi:hypothetical protein
MKTNMENMESEMDSLNERCEGISSTSADINTKMATKRDKVDKLVRLRDLLKKLEFLFELPARLNQSIELEAYSRAAKYFNMTHGILCQYTHIPSFESIKEESEEIMGALREKLQGLIQGSDESMDQFKLSEYVGLLHQLKEPEPELQRAFLSWHTGFLSKILDRFQQEADTHFGGDEEQPEEEDKVLSVFIKRLNGHFVERFIDVAETYSKLFLGEQTKLERAQALVHGEEDDEEGALTRMLHFTKELFERYFEVLRTCFKKNHLTLPHDADGDDGRGEDGSLYADFTEALRQVMGDIHAANEQLREARLGEAAAEVLQEALRVQVEHVFANLRHDATEHLRITYAQVGPNVDDEPARPALSLALATKPLDEFVGRIEYGLGVAMPLVATGSELLPGMARIFCDQLRGQTQALLRWLIAVMETYCYPQREVAVAAELEFDQVQPPVLHVTPVFALLLACQCRELESNGITQIMTSLVNALPSAGRGPEVGQTDLSDLLKATKRTAKRLLQHFVTMNGAKVSQMLRTSIETKNWLKVKEPRDVRVVITLVLEELQAMSAQLRQILGDTHGGGTGAGSGGGSGSGGSGSEPSRRTSLNGTSSSSGASGVSGARGVQMDIERVQMDIERIFAKKVQIFGDVEFTRDSLVTGVFKISFKTFFECIRLSTFGRNGYQQIQVHY